MKWTFDGVNPMVLLGCMCYEVVHNHMDLSSGCSATISFIINPETPDATAGRNDLPSLAPSHIQGSQSGYSFRAVDTHGWLHCQAPYHGS